MLRHVVVGSAALALLAASMVRAEDQPEGKKIFRLGPAQVEIELKAAEAPPAPEGPTGIFFQKVEGAAPGLFGIAATATTEPGEYWLGLQVSQPGDEVRANLKLPEDQGLPVEEVIPDSPAARAGIKAKDVLMKAGDKKLSTPKDLIDAVQQAKETKLKLELLRDGKTEKIDVAPAKRPPGTFNLPMPPEAGWGQVQKWFEQFEKGEGQPGAMQFRLLRPGVIVPPGAGGRLDVLIERHLPDDMTIAITKTGKKPAEIVVKQGDQKWEVNEKQLDELPEKVRPHVERMLGWGPLGRGAVVYSAVPGAPGPVTKPLPGQVLHDRLMLAPGHDGRIEKRLDEMSQQIEKLQKAIEDLKASQAKPRKAKDSTKEKAAK